MSSSLNETLSRLTGATELRFREAVQALWSGYGSIDRYDVLGSEKGTIIVKHVKLPNERQHPRGWKTDHAHQRKLRSYQVETAWYQGWAERCDANSRVPHCIALEQCNDGFLMVLEDLNSSGFPVRKEMGQVGKLQIKACLQWLAHFHARFMGAKPNALWEVGTYWHLATRPDELDAMPNGKLKRAANKLDEILNNAPYQTIVHGDAKLANFCFSADASEVAAVDFQYVGGGCGMKDVAYFLGSCFNEVECERHEGWALDFYFSELEMALAQHNPSINCVLLEAAWRPLYPVAWTDFYRFLQGWSPNHWKIHRYSERLASEVLAAFTP